MITANLNTIYESISIYLYKGSRNTFFINNINEIDINDFLLLKINKKNDKIYFVNTNFFLSKMLARENIDKYIKLIKLIQEKLSIFNKLGYGIIFDYLPLRFLGESYLKNNYFFSNFANQNKLKSYIVNSYNTKNYSKGVSIQVLISRLDFLEDLFNSIKEQTTDIKEIFLYINFKDKKDIISFEKKLLLFFNYTDNNLILNYSVNEVSESVARVFMPTFSKCQYILPLDDDDFLDKDCLIEVENILEKYGDFSLIRGLLKGVNKNERFGKTKDIEKSLLLKKVKNEFTRRSGKFLLANNLASVDQLYVYNSDLLKYFGNIVPTNLINNTGIEIEIFLKSEEIGGVFLIDKVLYFKRYWEGQVTNNFLFQQELFIYLFELINKVIKNRNIEDKIQIELFPYIRIN